MMTTRRQMREAKRIRSRRIRAVLAGGLVFGVGAAATLAAWNDSEYATSTFTAGTFGITGSPTGHTFTDYTASGTPAPLNFQIAPTAMTPGMTTYALFSVKTLVDSVAGDVQLTAETPGGTGLAAHLTYGVSLIPTPVEGNDASKCNAMTFAAGTEVIPSGTALETDAAATQAVGANGSGQVNYCFAVTLDLSAPNAAQGLTMSQTWQFAGTSS